MSPSPPAKPRRVKRPKPEKAWALSYCNDPSPNPTQVALLRSELPERMTGQRAMRVLIVPLVEPTEEELEQIKNSVHAVAGHVLTTDAARWLWALGARPQGGSK